MNNLQRMLRQINVEDYGISQDEVQLPELPNFDWDDSDPLVEQTTKAVENLTETMESIRRTGKISMRDVMTLESISPGMVYSRLPLHAFTEVPSFENYAVTMEMSEGMLTGLKVAAGIAIVAAIAALIKKIWDMIKGSPGGSVSASLDKAAAAQDSAVKDSEKAGKDLHSGLAESEVGADLSKIKVDVSLLNADADAAKTAVEAMLAQHPQGGESKASDVALAMSAISLIAEDHAVTGNTHAGKTLDKAVADVVSTMLYPKSEIYPEALLGSEISNAFEHPGKIIEMLKETDKQLATGMAEWKKLPFAGKLGDTAKLYEAALSAIARPDYNGESLGDVSSMMGDDGIDEMHAKAANFGMILSMGEGILTELSAKSPYAHLAKPMSAVINDTAAIKNVGVACAALERIMPELDKLQELFTKEIPAMQKVIDEIRKADADKSLGGNTTDMKLAYIAEQGIKHGSRAINLIARAMGASLAVGKHLESVATRVTGAAGKRTKKAEALIKKIQSYKIV
jgi:hypothetical protein